MGLWLPCDAQQDSAAVSCRQVSPCIVAGCENRIRDKRFDDMRINFGVVNLIGARLHESGCFRLVEEKARIRDKLRQLQGPLWRGGGKKTYARLRQLSDSSIIAVGRLLYCGTPRASMGVGPFHVSRAHVVIDIEVLLQYPGGDRVSGTGRGKASRTAMSTLYTYRDDRVLFDQSDIGKATAAAVREAVDDVLSHHIQRMNVHE
jgi:hypothetical protein